MSLHTRSSFYQTKNTHLLQGFRQRTDPGDKDILGTPYTSSCYMVYYALRFGALTVEGF